jgi:hypothetical protein
MATISCNTALLVHKSAVRWWNLWNVLTYIFGIFLIAILIFLIIGIIQSIVTQAVVGLIGTVVDGVALKWVVTQRSTAYTEEQTALKAIENDCKDQYAEALALRAKYNLK